MDIPGEIANIHMTIDAKNLVTTARTLHLPEQKETIHILSMLRKEVCSGKFIILLTSQPEIAWQIASQKLQRKRTI